MQKSQSIENHLGKSKSLKSNKAIEEVFPNELYIYIEEVFPVRIITFKANNVPTHLCRTSCTTPPLPFPMTFTVSRSSDETSKSSSLLSEGCPKLQIDNNFFKKKFEITHLSIHKHAKENKIVISTETWKQHC